MHLTDFVKLMDSLRSLWQGESLLAGIVDIVPPVCKDPSACWEPTRVVLLSAVFHA